MTRAPLTHASMTLALALLCSVGTGTPVRANPTVDEVKAGRCLDLRVDGQAWPCNHDLRLVDDGQGEVSFVTGYGDGRSGPKMVIALFTAQAPDMENAYGYALRVTGLTLMAVGAPERQRRVPATGLCFMVKPNPLTAGPRPVRQDIVVMCSASPAPANASTAEASATGAAPVEKTPEPGIELRRLDWKFVF